MNEGLEYANASPWGALATKGDPRPFLHIGLIRRTRREVQEELGEVWARKGETPMQGWKRAYRAGWRAVRVVAQPWDLEVRKHISEKPNNKDVKC